MATVFQGGIALLAFGIAWLLGINPFDQFSITFQAVAVGIAATIPMLLMFAVTYRLAAGPFADIKRFLIESLGPFLADCRWYDLAWVALLAGVSEELMFRAVLQQWLNQWGTVPALIVSNIVFGVVHYVTPLYPILAGLMGMYLGAIYQFAGTGNLLVPTVTHALYDFVAFLVIRRSYLSRQHEAAPSPDTAETA